MVNDNFDLALLIISLLGAITTLFCFTLPRVYRRLLAYYGAWRVRLIFATAYRVRQLLEEQSEHSVQRRHSD